MLSGRTTDIAVKVGPINTTGGASGTGTVDIRNASPATGAAGVTITNAMLKGAFYTTAGLSGSISTGSITTTGANVTVLGGSYSTFGTLSTSNLTSGGGAVLIDTSNGVSTAAINTSSSGGAGGSVVVLTGNRSNAAGLSVGQIDTWGAGGGLVELVNSAANTSSVNMTVDGTINADAVGLNGAAGPVALVASGAINVRGAISTQASANGASESALGGSVFVSSGGTGAVAITCGAINTSATSGREGNKAGNIILLSAFGTSRNNPSNIAASSANFTQAGGTPGTYIIYGLSGASTTLPANLNVTPTSSINIRPGGYQSSSGSYIRLTLNTGGDRQLVAPINIGTTGTSLYLTSITQNSASDNVSIVLGGGLTTNGAISVTAPSVGVYTNGLISIGGALNLSASGNITVADLSSNGINGLYDLTAEAGGNLQLLANTYGSSYSGNCGSVTLTAGASITAGYIYSNSNGGKGGAVTLTAGTSISTGYIYSYSYSNDVGAVKLRAGSSISGGYIHSESIRRVWRRSVPVSRHQHLYRLYRNAFL